MLGEWGFVLHGLARRARRKFRQVVLALGTCVLAACVAATDGDVILPAGANLETVSPDLKWVAYESRGAVWLAPLRRDDEAVALAPPAGDTVSWSMHAAWMPDSSGILLKSFDVGDGSETWWLVKVEAVDSRWPLCTLGAAERVPVWSPTGDAIALTGRGGAVTLMWTDGHGCEELPIPGLVMKTPSLSWSPDGHEIAYVDVPREGPEWAEVRSYHIKTKETRTVYNGGGLPKWFPGGERIALLGWTGVIPVVHADGSGLIGSVDVPEGYAIGSVVDSKAAQGVSRLALSLKPTDRETFPDAVGILDGDALAIVVIEAPSYLEIVGWTPDGEHIAVLAPGAGETTVLRALEVTR
jgi:hypothetical protein